MRFQEIYLGFSLVLFLLWFAHANEKRKWTKPPLLGRDSQGESKSIATSTTRRSLPIDLLKDIHSTKTPLKDCRTTKLGVTAYLCDELYIAMLSETNLVNRTGGGWSLEYKDNPGREITRGKGAAPNFSSELAEFGLWFATNGSIQLYNRRSLWFPWSGNYTFVNTLSITYSKELQYTLEFAPLERIIETSMGNFSTFTIRKLNVHLLHFHVYSKLCNTEKKRKYKVECRVSSSRYIVNSVNNFESVLIFEDEDPKIDAISRQVPDESICRNIWYSKITHCFRGLLIRSNLLKGNTSNDCFKLPLLSRNLYEEKSYRVLKYKVELERIDTNIHQLLNHFLEYNRTAFLWLEELGFSVSLLTSLAEFHYARLMMYLASRAQGLTWLQITRCGLNARYFELYTEGNITYFEEFDETQKQLAFRSLKFLDLSGNKFQFLTPWFIHALWNIKQLNLSNQNVLFFRFVTREEHYADSLSFKHLETLDLSSNYILGIEWLRRLFPRVENLNLSHANLFELPGNTFHGLTWLRRVDLSHNSIIHVFPNTFASLKPKAVIHLSFNMLTNLHLQDMPDVDIIDLSNNQLTTIPCLHNSQSIKDMDLSSNALNDWHSKEEFACTKGKINVLNLRNNKLFHVNLEAMEFMKRIDTVDLGSNAVDCDQCTLPYLQDLINSTLILNDGKNNSLKCVDRSHANVEVTQAILNQACLPKFLRNIVLPVGVVVAFLLLLGILFYVYRFEISYIRHMLKAKRRHQTKSRRFDPSVYEFDAFVCFCHTERQWVMENLVPSLENSEDQYQLCLHDRDFKFGSYIVESAAKYIFTSCNVILLLSKEFIKNKWCCWELMLIQERILDAKCNADFLIIVEMERLDKSALPLTLRLLLDYWGFIKWPDSADVIEDKDSQAKFFNNLKRALGPAHCRPDSMENSSDASSEHNF